MICSTDVESDNITEVFDDNGSMLKIFTWNNFDSMNPILDPYVYDFKYNYVKLNFYNENNESAQLYNDNINLFNADMVYTQGQNVFVIYQNGKYIFHAEDKNGNDIYQLVEIDTIKQPMPTSVMVIPETSAESNTYSAQIRTLGFAGGKFGAFDIGDNFLYLCAEVAPYTESESVNGYIPETNYEAKRIFEEKNQNNLKRIGQGVPAYWNISENGKYALYCMDNWGNASVTFVNIDCIPKSE